MTKIFYLFSLFYTWPLWVYYKILLLMNHKGAILFKQDLDFRSSKRTYCKGFFPLMFHVKCYRNLYYKRLAPWSSIFRIICPQDKTLIIDGKNMPLGKGVWLEHSFRTIIHAQSIGQHFKVWHNCTIGSKNGELPIIGNNVTVCANAMILGGVTIGDNVVIGAGAVVVKNVPSNCTVIGNPSFIVKLKGEKVKIEL